MTKLIRWLRTQELPENKQELIILLECLIPNLLGIAVSNYFGIALALIILLYHFLHDKK
jgi:hypothetical protein